MINLVLIIVLAIGLWCEWAQAKSYQTQQQALAGTFLSDHVARKTLFLTTDQVKQIEQLGKVKVYFRIVSYYVGKNASGATETAFFDRQVVRTMPMTYMVVVRPAGELDRVEILSFDEPDDYLPPTRWLQLYRNRVLSDDLRIGSAIPHITGASLTSQAVNDGVRRALAIYAVAVKGAS